MVKEFLAELGVEYELRNVAQDSRALREFLELGAALPPVVAYRGRWVEGYKPDRIEELLRDALAQG